MSKLNHLPTMYDTPKSTGKNSEHYGPCEVCGKHMSDAHIQRVYKEKHSKVIAPHHRFGHEKCLSNNEFPRPVFG